MFNENMLPVLSRKVENKVGDSPGPPPSCKQQPGWPIFQITQEKYNFIVQRALLNIHRYR